MVDQYTDQTIPFISGSNFGLVLQQIVDILVLEEANQLVQADNSVKAQGTLTLPVNPKDGDQMVVDAKTYTFQDVLTDFDGNIQIGADVKLTYLNIVSAFDLSGVAGTDYAASMTAHPTVDIFTFFIATGKSILAAKTSGTAGNSIVTTQTFTDSLNIFDAATLGTTQTGGVIDINDFKFKTVREIHEPFQAFSDFSIPIVNVWYKRSQFKERSKLDKKHTVAYIIDIYTEFSSTQTEQGLTLSSDRSNLVIAQILYILESPKYKNLRLEYQDQDGNLVKFIEKLSVSSAEKVFQDEPLPKENVVWSQIIFNVDIVEFLFDLNGKQLTLINAVLLEPTTQ